MWEQCNGMHGLHMFLLEQSQVCYPEIIQEFMQYMIPERILTQYTTKLDGTIYGEGYLQVKWKSLYGIAWLLWLWLKYIVLFKQLLKCVCQHGNTQQSALFVIAALHNSREVIEHIVQHHHYVTRDRMVVPNKKI